jgi:alkylation response protein AidB-like acyl-CoA dehydrogenase
VDFRYTEEQLALQETLQRFIAREYDFERRRALARSSLGFSAENWRQFADLGVLALPFPRDFGGLDGGAIEIMIVMEQVGRGLLLEPYLSTVVLCGGLIRDAASDAMRRQLLPRIGAGTLKVALAAYEAPGRYELSHVACTGMRTSDGWLLSGRKSVVIDAPSADSFIVSARIEGAVGEAEGISLFLVPSDAAGLTQSAYLTHSGSRAADLDLRNVAVGSESMIGAPGKALGLLERAVDKAIAALCAEALGIATMLNQLTLSYLKTRKQFGVPIGSFQSLQHRMAEMYIAEEQARSMTILAAMQADADMAAGPHRTIAGAKAYIGRAARFIGQQAIQLHGAMGMVDDLIVSHYFKRLTLIDLTLGDADFHLARFSDSLTR